MDKIRHDKGIEVHTRLNFRENSKKSRRIREDSQNSNAKTLSVRHRNLSERPQIRDRLRNNDGNVFGRLGHRRESTFKRLSDTYSPNTTKSEPDIEYSRDDSTIEVFLTNRTLLLAEIVLEAGVAPTTSKNRMVIPTLTEQGTNIDEEYLAVPWSCEEVDPFTPRIRNFKSSRKTQMPNNVKTYDGTGDPEDHVKKFQAATQVEHWAMPTWCHMLNSTLIGTARQKKYVKDLVEIHNIKQKDGETIEEFMERFKIKTGRMKGAPECILEEMMTATAAFIRGETAVASKKKVHTPWKSQDQSKRQNFERRSDFRRKFRPPPPMVTPVEKRSSNKFCEFHNDKGHNTDECVQLRKNIEELVRAGRLSHFIKEIKRDRDQQKTRKKDAPVKDKAVAIYMIQPWQRVMRQKVTQSFSHVKEIMFPPLAAHKGTGGPLVIEAEINGHAVHRIYVDIGSSMEVLYEHCFNRLRPEIKRQMVPATTSLTSFMRSPSPYNGIIGRPGIREIQAVPSTAHGMLKFRVKGGIVTIRSTILTPTDCTTIATTPKDHAKKADIPVRHDRSTMIDCRAPTQYPRRILPCQTEKQRQAPERTKAIQVEVQKLVEAGILQKVYYHDWLSNPVMKLIGRSNPSAATPLSISWMPTKDIIKYRWPNKMRKKWLSTLVTGRRNVSGIHDQSRRNNFVPRQDEEKSLPLFKILKKCIKKSDFHWTPNAKQAFKQLKQHLARLPMLVAPKPKEELIMYLSASYGAISVVLMTERDTVQTPVYFVSRALQTPELNYTPMEKLVLALVCAAKRPRRLQKLNVMLEEHNITYRPRIYVKEFTYELRFQFTASNNEAEYEALIAGLRIAAQMGVRNVCVSVDSKLVANQVLGTYVVKEENIVKYLEKAKSLISGFANFSISQVPRSKNKKADALSKIASTSFAHLSKQVLVEVLKEKSIQEEVATVVEEEGPTWMTMIMEYLKDGTLPTDQKEARKLCIKARQYEFWEGVLYRQSFLKPWLRCVRPLQADYVIQEIYEGSGSMYAGPRSVIAKAMRLGYYWPIMHQDARDMTRTCNACQVHRPVPRNPQQPLTLIMTPCPFYKWGIDIASPFPKGPGKVKKFVWDNIVCRFSLPGEIVSDNGKQFSDKPFKDWCEKLNITQQFTSVKHSQSNRLVERANRSLGKGIKARLSEGNKNWIEELPNVLWAHRTMIKSSHGDTLFSLTYEMKVVLPAEIKMPTYHTVVVDVVHNNQEIRLNLDLLEEWRECIAIREAKAKLKMTKYYNTRAHDVTFRPEDFVYHTNEASHAMDGGKLGPKWERPYKV
nr:reverse transcriptase domain-containing protein [Tanacetum cinerariifolium]